MIDHKPPGPGHNQPPEDPFKALAMRTGELTVNANRWRKNRPELTSEDEATSALNFIRQIEAALKDVESARRDVAKPLEEQIDASNRRYRHLTDLLKTSRDNIEPLCEDWLARLQEQRAADILSASKLVQRLRSRATVAAVNANEPGATVQQIVAKDNAERLLKEAEKRLRKLEREPVKIDSTMGRGTTGKRKKPTGTVTDWSAAVAHYAAHDKVKEAVQKLVNKDVRSGATEIPGVTIEGE